MRSDVRRRGQPEGPVLGVDAGRLVPVREDAVNGPHDWDEFRAACLELEAWLRGRIEAHGIRFECCPDAPGTMEALAATGLGADVVPVPTYVGRPDTIYSDGGRNKCLYQAYHDWAHRETGLGFSESDEFALAMQHQWEALATGLGWQAAKLLWVESWVRVRYYLLWGRFFQNEKLSHWICWTQGEDAVMDMEGI